MLILTRKPGESIFIGDNVKITIVEIKGHQIRMGIDAPADIRIYREEIYLQILEENKQAAASDGPQDAGLERLTSSWKGDTSSGGLSAKLGGGSKLGSSPINQKKDTAITSPASVDTKFSVTKRRKKREEREKPDSETEGNDE